MPVEKTARSRSSDPVQEHLRERKQSWNKACSEFIARLNSFKPHLISFKRGLNGRGDQKAGLPISNIKDPLPSEISSYLSLTSSEFGELASTFQSLVSEANSIVQEQAEYAMKRRKHQNNVLMIHPNVPKAANLNKIDDGLMAEGSNALSRYWAKIAPTWFSKESPQIRLERLSMLSMAHKLFEDLIDLEDAFLAKGLDNTEEIYNLYSSIGNQIKSLRLSYNRLINLNKGSQTEVIRMPTQPSVQSTPNLNPTSSPSENASPKEDYITNISPATNVSPMVGHTKKLDDYGLIAVNEETSVDTLKNNIVIMMNEGKEIGFGVDDVRPFLQMYHNRKKEADQRKRDLMEDRLRSIYEEIYDSFAALHKKASIVNKLELISLAKDNPAIRLLKKLRNQLTTPDDATASRTQAYRETRLVKKYADEIMDLLEDRDMNINVLQEKLSKVEEHFIKLTPSLQILFTLYKKPFLENRNNKKRVFNPSDRYFTKQIRRDVDQPGW